MSATATPSGEAKAAPARAIWPLPLVSLTMAGSPAVLASIVVTLAPAAIEADTL